MAADDPAADAEVAAAVCGELLEWRNDVGEQLNQAQRAIIDDGAEPGDEIGGRFDDLVVRTGDLLTSLDALALDDADRGESALATDLRDGVEGARATFEELGAEYGSLPDPDPESVQSRVATAFVETEKPIELVKPEVNGDLDDPGLEAAFADEPDCRHTTRR